LSDETNNVVEETAAAEVVAEVEAPVVAEAPVAEVAVEVVAAEPVAETPAEAPKPKSTRKAAAKAAPVVEEAPVVVEPVEEAAAGLERTRRKTRQGRVTSNKMDKTVVVTVERRVRHPLYGKFMTRTKKYAAHDETNDCHEGDVVEIMETRPLSKTKTWRVIRVVERAK